MATSFFPFDAGAGSAITEAQWQKMARRWLNTGVIDDHLNELAVTADGSAMSVSVNTGGTWIRGFYFESDAAVALTIAAADATNPRIDSVVVRLDRTANTMALAVVTGTAASSPVAPTLSATDGLYELLLATVRVEAAVGVIAADKVTDGRTYAANLSTTAASAAYRAKAAAACRVTTGTAVSIPDATTTVLAWDVEAFDSNGFHDNVTNNSRLTVPAGLGGTYLVTGQVSFAANATGDRMLTINKNGLVDAQASARATAALHHRQQIAAELVLAAGDYVELTAYQTSGGALGTNASAIEGWFALTYQGS